MPDHKCIFFFNEAPINYNLRHKTKIRKWIRETAGHEKNQIIQLNYIFCSDEYLLQMNQQYLNHHTYTDIISFDNSEKLGAIEGDIFISIERVKENAIVFKVPFIHELFRVMIHGVLHLCGYMDKSKAQKKQMRDKEDFYVQRLLTSI